LKKLAILLLLLAAPLFSQSNTGELHFKVTDPAGLGVKVTVSLSSDANEYRNSFSSSDQGVLEVQRLPYGVYGLEISASGFAPVAQTVEIRSSIATELVIQLKLPTVNQSVTVITPDTLIDPDQAGAVSQIGSDAIQHRLSSIPGRSIQDLVNSQPGWLYEGNAVLHPRGSEYQTQFVVDGIPLTDDRSPSFGPEIEADDVQSISIYTAGIPAEYGRKMGGVVEVNTLQDPTEGFHGQVVLSGGSFDSAGAFAQGQYVWGKTRWAPAPAGDDRPLSESSGAENFTNTGTLGDFSLHYQRSLTPNDRLSLIVRHELSRYELPNEFVQQTPHDIFPLDPRRRWARSARTPTTSRPWASSTTSILFRPMW
jgi:outer membrane receptor protein involved in Fe transport